MSEEAFVAEGVKLPSADDISALPLWARVAFAARCARRVLPLFGTDWPNAPEQHLAAVDLAVTRTEQAAASPNTDASSRPGEPHIREAVADVLADAKMSAVTRSSDPSQAAGVAAAVYMAADARDAACAAYGTADRRHAASQEAYQAAAYSDLASGGDAFAGILQDFQDLLRRARNESWTDETPVPPDVFGPLYQRAPGLSLDPQVVLALRAVAEPGVTADQISKHLVSVYRALNEYTLAKYGVLVEKDEFRRLVYEHAGVGVP